MIERLMDVKNTDDSDQQIDQNLRPKDFKNYIGQENMKQNLQLAITAAKKRDEPIDHVLLYGPPGLGKTTMATVIANEMAAQIRVTSGPAVERSGDLASLLTNLQDGDILFIDEIHRLNRTVEEVLYSAMEDFKLDIMLGKGPSARSLRLDLPKFTIIGATTRTGALSAPLRDRFGHIHRLEFYTPEQITKIVNRSAKILDVPIKPDAAELIAGRSRLTPRIANRLLKRLRDYADVNGDGIIDISIANKSLDLMEIDELGLDSADRLLLSAIIDNYHGGPVGVETLAALIADERSTIEDFYEPYLLQIGLLERTPRGRKATHKAYKHLGKPENRILPRAACYNSGMPLFNKFKITEIGRNLEIAKMSGTDENELCVIYQHPFGLIAIYVVSMIGLLTAILLAAISLSTFFNNVGNAGTYIVVAIFIMAVCVISILMIATIIYQQSKLTITDKNVNQIVQKGLFDRMVISVNLEDIEDVFSEQKGVFANVFGFGELIIETAGESVDINFGFCPNPHRVTDIILGAKDNYMRNIKNKATAEKDAIGH